MYKNYKVSEQEKKQILEMHGRHGYRKPLNEGEEPMNPESMAGPQNEGDPTRIIYPDAKKALGGLIGKTVNFEGVGRGRVIQVKIENITTAMEAEGVFGNKEWTTVDSWRLTPNKTDNVFNTPVGVYFDVDLINEYGESSGGIFGAGKFNNLDILFKCGQRFFHVGRELVGGENIKAGNENYVNEKLGMEIENRFCKVGKPVNKIRANY